MRMRGFATLALLGALALGAGAARAETPWLEAGDMRARQDVETLKSAGYIRGPIEAWPLPWVQLIEGVDAAQSPSAPPRVRAAAGRLAALANYARNRAQYEVTLAGTNRPALVRGFGFTARERGDVALRVAQSFGPLFVSYGVGYREGQQDRDFHFEPTYGALTLGNWSFYGGYVQKYWGPGYDGALALGTSARPFPKGGIMRMYPYAPEPKFLRWIGPWRFDIYGGVMNEERADSVNAANLGVQFSFEPVNGLEFNLKRTLVICGGKNRTDLETNPTSGGVCSAGDIVRGVIPFFPGSKPGDSMAGFSVSYTRDFGPLGTRFYYDVIGEDKAGEQQFEQVGETWGTAFTGGLGDSGASWKFYFEYTDTLANYWFQRNDTIPGSFYNNFFYFNGKTFKGDAWGHSIDGDSDLMTFAGSMTDGANRRWYAEYRMADIYKTEALNAAGYPANRVSGNREQINIVTAGSEWPTQFGDIRAEVRYMTDSPNTPGEKRDRGEFELSWRTRF